jgi:hypothetical protein
MCQEPLVHICNPSYSGSKDEEDRGSRPAQEISSQDSVSTEKYVHDDLHLLSQLLWEAIGGSQSRLNHAKSETLSPE